MQDKDYLKRCIELAKLGGKNTRPNPQVGALIVYKERIIGEGFHEKFGDHHAEANAINSVALIDKSLLPESTIYVSLEPCCHFGKTPPCTDLIIKNNIPRVCIAEVDPTEKVNNKGIQKLKDHGIKVSVIPIQDNSCIAEFKTSHLLNRPYVQLKFAKSKDNFIGQKERQVWLSNNTSNIFTHKLRSYTDGILVGTNTALIDNPSLTVRNYPGNNPMRILLDKSGRIPLTHTLLSDSLPCIIFTENKRIFSNKMKRQFLIDFSSDKFIHNLLAELHKAGIHHLMIEGGASVLKSFVESNNWDEAIIISTQKKLSEGLKAINIHGKIKSRFQLNNDEVCVVENSRSELII